MEKVGKYGQIINNKINYNEIWNKSNKLSQEFPEFSFEPIYSKDGKFSFGEPEWDENGNLYAGVNMAAGSVPCPTDCAILTLILCLEGGCITCPAGGRIKVTCDSLITAEVESNPYNKKVKININNSGEVALVKEGSYVKIDVSISDQDENNQLYAHDQMQAGQFPLDCPCSLACCECVSTLYLNMDKNLIKDKVIYRTKNINNNTRKTYFNKDHLTKIAAERLGKIRKN